MKGDMECGKLGTLENNFGCPACYTADMECGRLANLENNFGCPPCQPPLCGGATAGASNNFGCPCWLTPGYGCGGVGSLENNFGCPCIGKNKESNCDGRLDEPDAKDEHKEAV